MRFTFADIEIDSERREIVRVGAAVHVEPQVFDVLLHLVQNRGRVISKGDLFEAVWNGRIVSESTLTSRINAARRAVGDSGAEQKLIRTIARKGFRFIGEVCEAGAVADEPHAEDIAFATPVFDRPAIAVLPFSNMSGDPEQEYFSDGISEDIITALSKLRWFYVVARNSSFTFKGKAVHLAQVARELGVRYVLEGSVRREGNRVRITAQLNDATTGSHLWAERFDRDLTDVFALQDQITEDIVATIEPQLVAAEDFRARRKAPESLDAWDLLMRALPHYWRVTRQDNMVAQALLEKAIAIDPAYGRAFGVLAVTNTFAAHMGWAEIAAVTPIAEAAAKAAILSDSEDAWAHLALGSVNLFQRRFEDSLAAFETATQLNPSFSLALAYHGLVLTYCGRWQEGADAAHRALCLSPRDPFAAIYYGIASYAHFVGRDYDAAMRHAREAVRQRSDFVGGLRVLVAAAGMKGDAEIASKALADLRRAQPNISIAWIEANMPIRDEADRTHYLDGFRRAGLT
jgi:TolB-like protein